MKPIKKLVLLLAIIFLIVLVVLNYRTIENHIEEEPIKDIVEDKPKPSKEANLTLVGDFLYEEPYYASLEKGDDPELYFSKIKHYFQEDDLSIGNMEVVIGNDKLKTSGTGYSFCAPESIGKQVISLGMNVLSTANNHANDRGYEGRASTIEFFKNNSDILTVGTFLKGERDITKNIKEVNGIKFGFLAYTYGTNTRIPSDLKETIGLYRDPDGDHDNMVSKMKEEITTLREKVDCLIVIMHWGKEFTYTPNEPEKELATMMNSLGVDIILGSHSHSIQPIEWIKTDNHDTLVYYSMGNFVSADDDISRTGETFDNAYQFGLLSTLKVVKGNNVLEIKDVKAEPVINYYDKDMKNFELIPLSEYSNTYETSHYRYKYNFNRDFITNTFNKVIDEDFR